MRLQEKELVRSHLIPASIEIQECAASREFYHARQGGSREIAASGSNRGVARVKILDS
jgi:hypothetical protein